MEDGNCKPDDGHGATENGPLPNDILLVIIFNTQYSILNTKIMNLETKIMAEMKDAMKAKNEAGLRTLRAIKAEIIKAKTAPGAGGEIDETTEQKFLQKMVKQRKDSLEIFEQQGREDLALKEKEELEIIQRFLPKQMSEQEITDEVKNIIAVTGATSAADMGKVMGVATKQLAGKADGKIISAIVKLLLS